MKIQYQGSELSMLRVLQCLTCHGDLVGELFELGNKEAVKVMCVGVETAGLLHGRVETPLLEARKQQRLNNVSLRIIVVAASLICQSFSLE